ncbi:hypothetical protein XM50_13535 [Sphingomonas sp. Ag1]|nr:hypothetical protein XM50_13535 [Sphingomonas sp. Ag1]
MLAHPDDQGTVRISLHLRRRGGRARDRADIRDQHRRDCSFVRCQGIAGGRNGVHDAYPPSDIGVRAAGHDVHGDRLGADQVQNMARKG